MIKNLRVKTYYDSKGRPVCAQNFREGKHCIFLQTSKMGTQHHCFFDKDNEPLDDTRGDGTGFLMPCKKCPLHKYDSKSR